MIYFDKYQLFIDIEVTDRKTLGKNLGFETGKESTHHVVNLHFYSLPNKESKLDTIATYQPYPAFSYGELVSHVEAFVKKLDTKK